MQAQYCLHHCPGLCRVRARGICQLPHCCGLLITSCVTLQECFALTSQLLSRDAYALEVFPVHIAACVELQKKNELFLRGHRYGRLHYLGSCCSPALQEVQLHPLKRSQVEQAA